MPTFRVRSQFHLDGEPVRVGTFVSSGDISTAEEARLVEEGSLARVVKGNRKTQKAVDPAAS